MSIYEINARTIYNVAHDVSRSEEERLHLIAELLKLIYDGEVLGEDVVGGAPTKLR